MKNEKDLYNTIYTRYKTSKLFLSTYFSAKLIFLNKYKRSLVPKVGKLIPAV